MLTPTPFYYLRHGETDWNLEHRAQGQTDVPLNERGLAQARDAARRLVHIDIATICTSPLRRARDTALIIRERLPRRLVVVPELMEANWGPREGTVKGPWFADWENGLTPEGAEPYADFLARALRGINAALAETGPVLIVAHGAVYWAIERNAPIERAEAIPNGVPVRHEPPSAERPRWSAEPLE
jgi:probable phosphoglycerate mutase